MKIHIVTCCMVMEHDLHKGRFLDDYLLYLLARASAAASGQFHTELAAQGVSVPTWRVLAVLSDGPSTVGRLAGAVMLKQTTLSKALDRLERDGLVHRARESRDRREVTVSLSQAGAELSTRLRTLALAHQRKLMEPYPPQDQALLHKVLKDFLKLAEG